MKIDSSNIASMYGNQPARTGNAKNVSVKADKQESINVQDKVQLSSVASTSEQTSGINENKVAELKARIASGEYQPNANNIANKLLQTYKF